MTNWAHHPLFSQDVRDALLDEGYRFIRDSPGCEEDRKALASMWVRFERLADHNFLEQCARAFEARAWEMRLGCGLVAAGHGVTSARVGPDFVVESNEATAYVEAVACSPTDGQRAFGEDLRSGRWRAGALGDQGLLMRLTSVLSTKRQQWARWVECGRVDPARPYVVAVNSGQIPMAWALEDPLDEHGSLPAIAKVLFGIGSFRWTLSAESGDVLSAGRRYQPELRKANGAAIDGELFRADGAPEVSAVIYSSSHFRNRPGIRGRPACSDVCVIHNPHAAMPVEDDFFALGRVFTVTDDRLVQVVDWRCDRPLR